MSEKAAFARKTYALLGVAAGCGEAALKKAYRQASLKYHPDRLSGQDKAAKEASSAMFVKVKEAFDLLSDAKKRAELDEAVASVERASAAQAERWAKMDGTRRRMRQDLERREQAARASSGRVDDVELMRRTNAERTERYERERSAAAASATKSAELRRRAREADAERERSSRLRRSLKLRWKSDSPVSDDDLVALVRRFGVVEAVNRSDSGKAATVIFETEDAAVEAAIDETLIENFKEVKLCSYDAHDRFRRAVVERVKRNNPTPDTTERQRTVDHATTEHKRKLERAALRAKLLRDAAGTSEVNVPLANAEIDREKRPRLAALVEAHRNNAASHPTFRAIADTEFNILTRLITAAPPRG